MREARRALGAAGGLALALLALATGGCRLGDLVNTPQASPSSPQALAQTKSDGATIIAPGATTNESSVTLSATVGDPDAADRVVLEVEVRTRGVAFSDTATAASAPRASGAVASVAVSGLADNLGYHWRARAVDETGRASAWIPFGASAEAQDFAVDAVAESPDLPAGLAQLKSDGTTAIALGAVTDETTVIFQATLTDPDPGDSLRLQIERQPLGTAFTGTPTGVSPTPVTSGGTARVTVSGQLDNLSYHWQARAMDHTGLASPWVSFGANPEVQADYRIDIPEPPVAPTSLGQFRQNGQTPILVGDTTSQNAVVFKGTVNDPDQGDQVRLEVEVQLVGVGFSGTPTATGTLVASGAQSQVTVQGLASGDYHWQARAADQTGRTSSWVAFGNNQENLPDFSKR